MPPSSLLPPTALSRHCYSASLSHPEFASFYFNKLNVSCFVFAEGNTIGFDHTICSPRFWIRIWAIFGFFIALGRSTRSFLLANGFDTLDDPLEDFIRYLIGGSILYYPQLSSISSFQLYVEVGI
ncbi:hypothetical protein S245_005201 [Arachis hypogaea]